MMTNAGSRTVSLTRLARVLLILALVLVLAGSALAQGFPPKQDKIVQDHLSNPLPAEDKERLEKALEAYPNEVFKVVFVDTTGDRDPSEYSAEMFDAYGLGPNAILIMVAMEDRAMRTTVGRTFDAYLPPSEIDRISAAAFTPLAKQGQFADAVLALAEEFHQAIVAGLNSPAPQPAPLPAPSPSPSPRPQPTPYPETGPTRPYETGPRVPVNQGQFGPLLVVLVAVLLVAALGFYVRERRRLAADARAAMAAAKEAYSQSASRFVALNDEVNYLSKGRGETEKARQTLDEEVTRASRAFEEVSKLMESMEDSLKSNRHREVLRLKPQVLQRSAELSELAGTAKDRADEYQQAFQLADDHLFEAAAALADLKKRIGETAAKYAIVGLLDGERARGDSIETAGRADLANEDPLAAGAKARDLKELIGQAAERLAWAEKMGSEIPERQKALQEADRQLSGIRGKGYILKGEDPEAILKEAGRLLVEGTARLKAGKLDAAGQIFEASDVKHQEARSAWSRHLLAEAKATSFLSQSGSIESAMAAAAGQAGSLAGQLAAEFATSDNAWASRLPDEIRSLRDQLLARVPEIRSMIGQDRQDFLAAAEIVGGLESAWEENKNRQSQLGAVLTDGRGYRAALPQVAQDLEGQLTQYMGRLRAEGVNPTAEVGNAASQAAATLEELSRTASVRPLDLERARALTERATQAVADLGQLVERLIQEVRAARQALERVASRVARSHRAQGILQQAESVLVANDFGRVMALVHQAEAVAHQEELEEERRRQEAMRRAAAAAAAAMLRDRRGGGGGFGGFGGSGNRGGTGGSNWGGGGRSGGGGNRGGTGGSNW